MKGPQSHFTLSPSLNRKIRLEPIGHPVKMVNLTERDKDTVKVYTTCSVKIRKEPIFVSPLRNRKQESLTKAELQTMMLVPALSRNMKYFENKRFSV